MNLEEEVKRLGAERNHLISEKYRQYEEYLSLFQDLRALQKDFDNAKAEKSHLKAKADVLQEQVDGLKELDSTLRMIYIRSSSLFVVPMPSSSPTTNKPNRPFSGPL